ncbi:MAG TPA: hypothetical protein VH589_00150 [Trebonia sp.]
MALLIVIGIGLAVTSCGSAPATSNSAASATRSASGSHSASTVAPSPAASVPPGYSRIGGAEQGISVAAPASWVEINPTKETLQAAAKKLGTKGISPSVLVQDFEALQKQHGIIVFDVKSAIDSPGHFARNLNDYCVSSGVTDVGAAGIPFVKSAAAAEFGNVGATHVAQRDVEIGGVPGVETSYQLGSTSGTIYGSQLEVLPKQDKACFVTLSTGPGESADDILSVAAATAQFP